MVAFFKLTLYPDNELVVVVVFLLPDIAEFLHLKYRHRGLTHGSSIPKLRHRMTTKSSIRDESETNDK